MSVINKMLRDLDQRQAKASPQTTASTQPVGQRPRPAQHGMRSDTVHAAAGWRQRGLAPWLVGAAFIALTGAVGWWLTFATTPRMPNAEAWVAAPPATSPARSTAAAPVVAPTPLAASSAKATPRPPPSEPLPSQAEQPNSAQGAKAPIESGPPVVSAPVKPPVVLEAAAALGLRMTSDFSARQAPQPLPPERASSRTQPEVPPSRSQNPSPYDVLEQSQSLWNAGSREEAVHLLQDAVGLAERQGAGASAPQGNPVLLALVRELTRLQLVESRHAAVWELLSHLEPQLGRAPDLWAIRGNAAQRLGRHQDSVHAYSMALQSRPTEQRWLLGAAVSLAALGQLASAAEMADKARAIGTVSPDVLAYLSQQGVPLKDK